PTASFTIGTAGSFIITTIAFPVAALTISGVLPAGLTFQDNGDNTATLSGTPAAGTAGTIALTLRANNGVGPEVAQTLTLTIGQVAVVTSANAATFVEAQAGRFQVTATGSPMPTLSVSGALPSGVTFDAASGTLGGNP